MGFSDAEDRRFNEQRQASQANLSVEQRRQQANNARQWREHVSQPHFVLFVENNTNDHSFHASAWGESWQDAVDSFFGDGNAVRQAVSVVAVHDCTWAHQANADNRVDG